MSEQDVPVNIGSADIWSASDLDGCKVVFTGRLAEATRADVKELVESNGGKVTNNISRQSDLLVVGENPGSEKIEFLEEHGTPTLTETEFYSLFPDRFEQVEDVSEDSANQSTLSDSKGENLKIEVRPLIAYLVDSVVEQDEDKLDSFVTQSTRTLLKEVIDGSQFSTDTPEEATSISVRIPQNLLLMVDTAVETTGDVGTREEFVQEAVRRQVGFGSNSMSQESISLSLPKGVLAELETLSNQGDREVSEVGVELLLEGLEQRMVAR